jgi:hypothetical protein
VMHRKKIALKSPVVLTYFRDKSILELKYLISTYSCI